MNWGKLLGYFVVLSLFSLTGCVQDSPSSSREHTVSLLLELLRDENPETRRTALESLGKIGDPRTADPMIPLRHDPTATVREASVLAMGRVKPPATLDVIGILIQALQDPADSVRQAAVVAIGDIEPGIQLLQPLLALLKSSDVTIRRVVAKALLQVDASQVVPALIEAGRDPDAEVRQGIVAAVGEWGGGAVSPWLRQRLDQDPAPGVRAEAAYRLGMRSDPDTKTALEKAAATDTDNGVRGWAKRGI